MSIITDFFTRPDVRFKCLARLGVFDSMPDEEYLKKRFQLLCGYPLNLDDPKTFNEKIQWLKIYNRKSEYTTMVDKYAAKQWVAERIGEEYIIPTLGVWDHFEEIDFESLPDQFVLKCTHDSASVVIVKEKTKMDKLAAKRKLERGLRCQYYRLSREWPYKNVPPRIIAEEYIEDESGKTLVDYKMFCFNGEPKIMMIGKGDPHGAGRTRDFYDLELNLLPFTNRAPNSKDPLSGLPQLKEIISISEQLSADIPYLRVDTYIVNEKIYVGELTFYHNAGFTPFEPEMWDRKLGDLIRLPNMETKR